MSDGGISDLSPHSGNCYTKGNHLYKNNREIFFVCTAVPRRLSKEQILIFSPKQASKDVSISFYYLT